ncbi:MAG: rod shape-determining protein, partial [bacterium]|nr:rod shape-determining protein [bacterium]
LSGGAREVFMVEGAILAAIGARLPITESVGSMVIDIGGGKTEISVISLGGIVTSRSIHTAGIAMTRHIVQYAREVFNLLIGEMQAEQIKCLIGNCHPAFDGEHGVLRGRDLLSGLPKEIPVTDAQIREALQKPLKSLVSSIKTTLEQTPPELVADIYERGVVLSGGGSLLRGMERLVSEEAEVPVRLSDDPLTTVARGSGALLEDPSLRKAVTLPSTSRDTYR